MDRLLSSSSEPDLREPPECDQDLERILVAQDAEARHRYRCTSEMRLKLIELEKSRDAAAPADAPDSEAAIERLRSQISTILLAPLISDLAWLLLRKSRQDAPAEQVDAKQ